MSSGVEKYVTLGEITGVHGVKGWIKVYSFTHPPEALFDYCPWAVITHGKRRSLQLEDGRKHGQRLLAKLSKVDERDAAAALVGSEIAVARSAMPEPEPGEWYWCDLVGLTVRNEHGEALGRINKLFATGANDVIVVSGEDGEILIPFVQESVVKQIDLDAGEMTVAWETEFL